MSVLSNRKLKAINVKNAFVHSKSSSPLNALKEGDNIYVHFEGQMGLVQLNLHVLREELYGEGQKEGWPEFVGAIVYAECRERGTKWKLEMNVEEGKVSVGVASFSHDDDGGGGGFCNRFSLFCVAEQ